MEKSTDAETDTRQLTSILAGGALLATVWARTNMPNIPLHTLISSYGVDVCDSLVAYTALRNLNFTFFRKFGCAIPVVASMGIASVWELYQKAGMASGVYDPKDFLAYAAGAGIGIAIDKGTTRLFKKNLEEKI